MSLRELRKSKDLTQKEAAKIIGIPFRTYQNYEYGFVSSSSYLGRSIEKTLTEYEPYQIDKGILPLKYLVNKAEDVFAFFGIDYAYLFGSYAKGKATEKSDVDIMIHGSVTGLKFFSLQQKLESALHKKVDLVRFDDFKNNQEFLSEIVKTSKGLPLISKMPTPASISKLLFTCAMKSYATMTRSAFQVIANWSSMIFRR